MNKIISVLIFSLCSLPAFSQQLPEDTFPVLDTALTPTTPRIRKYPSRLWEITGNGLKQPSYLYGTMHVSKKLAFNLGDTFYKALQAVDVVALELQIDSWLGNIAQNREVSNPRGFESYASKPYSGYRGIYSSALEFNSNDLRDILGELNNYDYMSNYLLYRQGYQSPNYSEKTYVDMYIHQTGKKLGKYCTGLEDFEISRRMVNRADWRERVLTHKSNYSGYGRYGYGYGEDPTETAYREGDLDLIDSLDKKSNDNKFYRKWMLYERNQVMADEIERITHNKRLFAAVGCAHLPGDSGVIEMLRRKGFTVKPIYDKVGDFAFKQKLKLEGMSYPVSPKKYYSHNGELEFSLPGKPVDRSYLNNEEIFYADVANGAYYILKRLPWYGNMKGTSQKKFLQKIDSALYENIPGDITSKDKLVIGGNPALMVSNRTKSGETQRHMFLVLQNHIWYIKLSATGNYAESKEAKEFFKSVNFKQAKTEWNTYEPESGGYRIYWPAKVVIKPYSFDTSTDFRAHENLEFTDNKNNYYFFTQLPAGNYKEDKDTFHMHQMALNYAFYNNGILEKTEFKKIDGHQAMTGNVYFSKQKKHLHFLLAADGEIYYYLGAFTEDKLPPQDFINKFNFIPFKYKYLPIKRYDSAVKISYARPSWISIEKKYRIAREEKNLMKKYLKYPSRDGGDYSYFSTSADDDSFGGDYRSIVPIHFPSGEEVEVNLWKENTIGETGYFFKTLRKAGILKGANIDVKRYHFYFDSIQNHEKSEFKKRKKVRYVFEREDDNLLDTLYWSGKWLVMESVTGNKFNAKRQYRKILISDELSLNITTTYDNTRGISPMVKGIIESVQIPDSKFPKLDSVAFAKKIIQWLKSKDSIDLFKAADQRYSYSIIPKNFNDSIFVLMQKFDKNTDWGAEYASMLENKLVQDSYLPLISYYMNKFRRVGDTSETQAEMLVNLAHLKNKKAMDTLIYWLLEETPLAPENSYGSYSYSRIINAAFDSLKLWKSYYPKLLPLSRYQEYTDAIMGLGMSLLDSNFIDSSAFSSVIAELTLSFRDDLKRKMSKSSGSGYGSYGSGENYSTGDFDPDRYNYGSFNNALFANTGGDWSSGYGDEESYSDYGGSEEEYYLNQNRFNLRNTMGYYPAYSDYGYRRSYRNSGQSSGLFDKARILAKFYKKDADVAKRLNRVYQLKEKSEKMLYLDLFLKNGISIPDTMYNHYLSKKDCEFGFVQLLKKYKLESKIPANYFDEKNYATSFIYYHHFNEKNDSVVFLGKKSAKIENETGNLYFWKSREKEKNGVKSEELWQYSLVWIGSKDTLSKMEYPRYYKLDNTLGSKYTVRDMINNETAVLQYWNHYYWEQMVPKETETQYEGGGWDGE